MRVEDGGGSSSLLIAGFERHDVSPGTITSQADAVATPAGDVENFNADLTKKHNTAREGVAGVIATAMEGADAPTKNQARTLIQGITIGAGAIRHFGTAVETFNGAVDGLNNQIRSEKTREDQLKKKAALSGQHAGAVETLQSAARTAKGQLTDPLDPKHVSALYAAGALPSFAPAMFSNVADLTKVKLTALPVDLANMTDREQADYIKQNAATLDPALIALFGPAAKQMVAQDVGAAIKNKAIDRATVDVLSSLKNDPAFAKALYSTVTPDEFSKAIAHINLDLFGVGPDRNGATFPGTAKDKLALYDDFIDAAGVTLATYSRTVDADKLTDTWFDAITDRDNPTNAAALTLLLREGGEAGGEYDAAFISDLSSRVLDWERDQDDAVWGPLAEASGQWIRDPDRVTLNEYTFNNGYEDETNYTFEGGHATDGLANLLGAMGSSPEGAQRFFSDGDGVDDDRLEYLMFKRTFSSEGVTRSDEGDGLGEALEAATTGHLRSGENSGPPSLGDYTDERAAALASKVFTLIGENRGTGNTDHLLDPKKQGTGGGGIGDEWHMWSEMRDSIGNIGAGYAEDVYRTLANGQGVDGDGKLTVSYDNLNAVLGEIGRGDDKSGIEVLATALVIEGNDRMGEEIAEYEREAIAEWRAAHPNHPAGEPLPAEVMKNIKNASVLAEDSADRELTDVVEDNGRVLGRLLGQSVTVDMDDEEAAAARAALAAKAFDVATGFLPGNEVLGQGASELAKTAFDTAKSQGLDAIKSGVTSAPAPTSDAYRATTDNAWRENLQGGLANVLVQYGYTAGNDGQDLPRDALDSNGHVKREFVAEGGTAPTSWHDWWDSDAGNNYGTLRESMDQAFNNAEEEAVEDAKNREDDGNQESRGG
ncbi:hypothetical protein KV097_04485 [Mumia sp. zg.B17]|uniref:hypothetical protein n=1 Tax=Mumia sp. zg.B17 TaxID=2855446 RepID=UPI001C6EA02C|nr:hypothetical protein [Mumia sp. zg.B17]MBW9205191.1 hypothetical protein [Mumia sp. zg.B17]